MTLSFIERDVGLGRQKNFPLGHEIPLHTAAAVTTSGLLPSFGILKN